MLDTLRAYGMLSVMDNHSTTYTTRDTEAQTMSNRCTYCGMALRKKSSRTMHLVCVDRQEREAGRCPQHQPRGNRPCAVCGR
ncbi:MAG: hypothetical protein HW395_33 [candidate division NC10 bacterium]|nr:hypothetical protein [candidate division NC10 bacterium]